MHAKIGRRAALALIAPALDCSAVQAQAQVHPASAWPDRPVRLVTPAPPGTGVDLIARVLSEGFAPRYGQIFPVDGRPGAESLLAAEAHSRARPGETLLVAGLGIASTVPLMHEGLLPYDPADLTPVATLSTEFLCLAVPASLPVTSVAELVAHARARPGALNWLTIAGGMQLWFRIFQRDQGLDMTYVAYRATPQAILDLEAGRMQVLILPLTQMLAGIRAGRLRALAVTASLRSPSLPDIPTAREAGFLALESDAIIALFGWRGIPDSVRDLLAAEVVTVMNGPAGERLRAGGVLPRPGGPAEMVQLMATQRARTVEALRTLGPRLPG